MNQSSPIIYKTDCAITTAQFIDILQRSTLHERRPVEDVARIAAMLAHADLLVTAWCGEMLVGVARTITDFAYCAYLSDLAVATTHQRQGIGRELIAHSRAKLGSDTTLILLSAPAAVGYYPTLGFTPHDSAWVLRAGDALH